MKKYSEMTQQDFDGLLDWLTSNREEAGKKYEEIRKGLIRFFRFKGCHDPESLADETINRVAAKVSTFNSDKEVKTASYFYGFASKIYLESISGRAKKEVQLESDLPLKYKHTVLEAEDKHYSCLENCLTKLPPHERKMIISYYSQDKSAKFELRKRMAESMELKPGALHTRIHRIKNVLKQCVEKCLNEK